MSEKLTYYNEGDFLFPDLITPDDPNSGIWMLRRKDYPKKGKIAIYTGILLSGKTNAHLKEINQQPSLV